jgi:hypothetical protein
MVGSTIHGASTCIRATTRITSMFACATIVAKSYLSFARVLARSFRQHHPDVPFFVLLADEVDGYFDPAREPFDLIQLAELGIEHLEGFRFQYTQQPLSYAATPFLLAYLIRRGFTKVVFIKQESLVLGNLLSMVECLDTASIVMTPHLLTPLDGADRISRELNILQSGNFNGGILAVAAGRETERFLEWWQDRLRTHCRHAVAEGMHYEQRWLDLVPAIFGGVHILRDPAYNVGHWNLPERTIAVRHGTVLVHGEQCRLFRFSGYDPDQPQWATRYSQRLATGTLGAAASVFERFRSALLDEGFQETRRWPYAYGSFDSGQPVPDVVRQLYGQLNDAERFGDPLRTDHPGSYMRWLNESVGGPSPQKNMVTRLWHYIYECRPDLQRAFPDVLGADRGAFLDWTVCHGTREHHIGGDLITAARHEAG